MGLASFWNFITTQFRFSQDGMSQSWLFWVIILGVVLLKYKLRNGCSNKE